MISTSPDTNDPDQPDRRVKKRIPCTLNHADRHRSGMILNLSHGGVFVQTNLPAEPGSLVDIDFRGPDGDDFTALNAAVVWRRRVSPQLLGTTQSGMGLQFLVTPPTYDAMIDCIIVPAAASTMHAPEPFEPVEGETRSPGAATTEHARQAPRFLVRLAQAGGPRSRRIVVRCESKGAARAEALEQLGAGWTVLEVSEH